MALTGTLAPTAEEQALADQIEYANLLRRGALDTGGKMVGRHYVAKSPWENAIEGLVGGYQGASARGKQAEIEALRQKEEADWLGAKPSTTMEQTTEMQGPMPTGEAMAPVTKTVQKPWQQQMADAQQWAAQAPARSQLGQAVKAQMLTQTLNAPQRMMEKEEAAAIRVEEAKQRHQDRLAQIEAAAVQGRITREEADKRAADAKKELAVLVASLKPAPTPPAAQIITTDQGVFERTRDGTLKPLKTEDGTVLTKTTGAKKSAAEVKAASAVDEMLDKITAAEQGLPYASGMGAVVPQGVRQMVSSPQTKMADASIAALGAEQAHALYGAAFTAAEQARAAQFLPVTTGLMPDSADTIKNKLQVLRVLTEKKKARMEGKPDPYPNMYDNVLDPATKPISPAGGAPAAAPAANVDAEAVAWARANPNHPSSAAILKVNGVK